MSWYVAAMSDTCELYANKAWHLITVEQALTSYAERVLRCTECRGAVRAHRASNDGAMVAHFEHKVGHSGCSRGYNFDGTPKPHPAALEQ